MTRNCKRNFRKKKYITQLAGSEVIVDRGCFRL